jgi:hypothetical protein
MDALESLMMGSFAGLLVMFCYIKVILKMRGYNIHLFYNHGQDYQNFKQLIESEKDIKKTILSGNKAIDDTICMFTYRKCSCWCL